MDYDYGRYSPPPPPPPQLNRGRRGYNDYDDPRRAEDEDAFRRGHLSSKREDTYDRPRTMADRLDSQGGGAAGSAFVSPLQGAKIQVGAGVG